MKPTLVILTTLSFLTLLTHAVGAQGMQSGEYKLKLEEAEEDQAAQVTPAPDKTESPQAPISPTLFPHNEKTANLSLSLSTEDIDFGIITPTSPTERLFQLSLTGDASQFVLYTWQNHPLENLSKDIIPDTSCDNGNCSATIASAWESTLSFGLGFSCLSSSCDEDFLKQRYRPFGGVPISFAQGELGIGSKEVLTIPLRVNVPGTQVKGAYENTITILAVPNL